MKKGFLLFFASLLLASCQPDDITTSVKQELYPVKFILSPQTEILPFTKTKVMPPFDIPEPTAEMSGAENPSPPAESGELADFCSDVEYLVFEKADNTVLRHRHFNKDDDDYGIIYDSLPVGSYTIAIVAHSSVCKQLEGTQLSLENITDMFYAGKELAVSNREELVVDIQLGRIVSRIEFVSTDVATDNLASLDLHVSGYPDKIDLLSGKGIASSADKIFSYPFTQSDYNRTNLKFGFLTLVPQGGEMLDVNLVVNDSQGGEYYSRTINDILPYANRTVRYNGSLYPASASDDTLILTIEDEGRWGEDINHELPD